MIDRSEEQEENGQSWVAFGAIALLDGFLFVGLAGVGSRHKSIPLSSVSRKDSTLTLTLAVTLTWGGAAVSDGGVNRKEEKDDVLKR